MFIGRKRVIGAEPAGQIELPLAARDADHRMGAVGAGKLDVQQPGDAEPHHDDRLARKDVAQPLGVQTRRHRLDQRCDRRIELVGQRIDVGRRRHHVVGEAAIDVAPDQATVGAQVRLARPTGVAGPATVCRIDDHRRAAGNTAAGHGHRANRLVAHDARIGDRNAALVDFQIRAADARMRHADQCLAGIAGRPCDVRRRHFGNAIQNHRFHATPSPSPSDAPTRDPWR